MNKRFVLSALTATLLFTACGGGGGGGGTPSIGGGSSSGSTVSFSGFAIDPEIEGAEVSVICEGNRKFTAAKNTDSTGAFTVNGIPSDINLSTCIVSTYGGNDFGDDLSGITLKASYELFNANNNILITPLTTMLVEHDDFQTNPEVAKNEIATFFGVNEDDLIKNPLENLQIAKVTKKIITTALEVDTSSNKLGLVDINEAINNNGTFINYIDNEVSTKLDAEDFNDLKDEFTDFDNSSSIDEIKIATISKYAKDYIKSVFYFNLENNTFYETNKTTLETNIEYLAEQIAFANSELIDSKRVYYKLSSFHMRKALDDLQLTPKFKEVGGVIDYKELEDDVKNTLLHSALDLEAYVLANPIDILDIENYIIYDAQTSKKIVGNDNTQRREYYSLSNISNISKSLNLAENNLSDSVNDPINSEVANALGRMGFIEESIAYINSNIYTPSEQLLAYEALAKLFYSVNDNKSSAQSLTKAYDLLLQMVGQVDILGKDERNALLELLRNLIETGYYDDETASNIKGVNTLIEEFLSYSSYASNVNNFSEPRYAVSEYQNITYAMDDFATDLITYNNDINEAKNVYENKILPLMEDFPSDPVKGTALYHLITPFLHSKILGFDNSSILAKINNSAYSPKGIPSSYSYYFIISDSFDGKFTQALESLSNLKTSYKDDAINYGMGASLFLNGQENLLFDEYYTDSIYSSSKKDDLIKYATELKPTRFMSTTMILKILSDDATLKNYLDKLIVLANTWYLEGDTSSNISDSNALKVYAQWSKDSYSSRYGYLAIASMYKDINEDAKAIETIDLAIDKVSAFTDMSKKSEALFNIWDASLELGFKDDINLSKLLTQMEETALLNTVDDTHDIIRVANLFSLNNDKDKAKALIEHAYSLLDTLSNSNLDDVEDKIKALVGNYNFSDNDFSSSIANAHFQVGELQKAKDIVNEAYELVKSLRNGAIDTPTQYEMLVHIVAAFGGLNDLASLKAILPQIHTTTEKNDATVAGASAIANFDSFSSTSVASIDFDNDGKPDFFNYTATDKEIQDSGLVLDEDIDNDGITDDVDTLPYYEGSAI